MTFPRYPTYKDSGVEWLGVVPGHWQVKRLKQACHVFPSNVDKKSHDGETPVLLCNYTDVYYNETIETSMEFMAATASTDQIAKFTLRAGDTIITKDSETADDIAIAAHVPEDLPGIICGYHLSMVRPLPGTNGAFIKRIFDSIYAKSCFAILANGLTRVGLGQYALDNVELAFPPLPEQAQIAAFLDRETAKIDSLVAEQQRLMELLKEKRQVVISHAVTQGMNPDAVMKPSGIEWIGDVPKHWNNVKLKMLALNQPAAFTNGPFGSDLLTSELQTEGVPVIYIRDLKVDGYLRRSTSYVTGEKAIQLDKFRADQGDILMAKVGDPPGFCCTYPEGEPPGIICQDVIRMKPNLELISPIYLCFLLNSPPGIEAIDSICIQLTRKRFSLADIHSLRLPLPPRQEQEDISKWLAKAVDEFKILIAEAQRAIDLLRERRTALISAAVTGQIDVRQLAAKEAA